MMPEILFVGFVKSWNQTKLKKITIVNPKSELPKQFEYVDLESVVGTEMVSHRTEFKESAPSRAQRLAKKGDVFYQTVRPYQKNNYLYGLTYDNYVFSTGYTQLRPLGDSHFLLSRLQESNFVSRVLDRSTGTSYPSINTNDLSNIEIGIPSELEEEKKIGLLFKQIDGTITLQQQLLNDYKQFKKAMLQQLFPQKGETVPKVRFAGFYDEWKIKELGEVVQITMGQSPSSENYTDNPDDHILVQGNADMKNGRVVPRVWTTEITKTAEKDDLILSVRAPVGKIGRTDYNIVLGRGVAGIRGNHFIYYSLLQLDTSGYWVRFSTGSTFESINSKDIKEAIFLLPSDDEQEKIGNFFKQLDETIAGHEQKLATYQELKKALLQRMFV